MEEKLKLELESKLKAIRALEVQVIQLLDMDKVVYDLN